MFRCDGHTFDVVLIQGEGLRLVEATPEDLAFWREEHRGEVPSISLPVGEIRACFEGPLLVRCQKIATLGPARFLVLFGQAHKSHRYSHARQLRKIGRAIPAPLPPPEGGCGRCIELLSACVGCARRIVSEALATTPLRFLRVVAQHVDPIEQLRKARALRLEELAKLVPRNRRTRALPPWERRGRDPWS